MSVAPYAFALAALAALVADVLGAHVPRGTGLFAMLALGAIGMAQALRYSGMSAWGGRRASQAAIASDGWRKDTFVMGGLEEDGEALQEYTDEAGMYGYRREQGDDAYSWRFIRERHR